MRLWVVNVGANTGDASKHRLRSPVLPDGSFEFVPIVERVQDVVGAPKYRDLPSWTRPGTLSPIIPAAMHDVRAHLDPDFANLTYGDAQKPRGISLRHISPGDQLWFMARLWGYDQRCGFTGPSDFFFVGVFAVEANLLFANGEGTCPAALRQRLERNAHWHRRAIGDRGTFRVIFGRPDTSCAFAKPIRVTPDVAGHLYAASYDPRTDQFMANGAVALNKNGKPRTWRHFCSVTRTIQAYLDSANPAHVPHLDRLGELARLARAARPPVPDAGARRSSP